MAKRKLTLETFVIGWGVLVAVTLDHILKAKCKDPNFCMVKLAVYDLFAEKFGVKVKRVRVRGNGIVVTLYVDDGRIVTLTFHCPIAPYNRICTFDHADAAIKAAPERKKEILSAMGVVPFTFNMKLIERRVSSPITPEEQAKVTANLRRIKAYWGRQETKPEKWNNVNGRYVQVAGPGCTPMSYLGSRKGGRYDSTANPPSRATIRRGFKAAGVQPGQGELPL